MRRTERNGRFVTRLISVCHPAVAVNPAGNRSTEAPGGGISHPKMTRQALSASPWWRVRWSFSLSVLDNLLLRFRAKRLCSVAQKLENNEQNLDVENMDQTRGRKYFICRLFFILSDFLISSAAAAQIFLELIFLLIKSRPKHSASGRFRVFFWFAVSFKMFCACFTLMPFDSAENKSPTQSPSEAVCTHVSSFPQALFPNFNDSAMKTRTPCQTQPMNILNPLLPPAGPNRHTAWIVCQAADSWSLFFPHY